MCRTPAAEAVAVQPRGPGAMEAAYRRGKRSDGGQDS